MRKLVTSKKCIKYILTQELCKEQMLHLHCSNKRSLKQLETESVKPTQPTDASQATNTKHLQRVIVPNFADLHAMAANNCANQFVRHIQRFRDLTTTDLRPTSTAITTTTTSSHYCYHTHTHTHRPSM